MTTASARFTTSVKPRANRFRQADRLLDVAMAEPVPAFRFAAAHFAAWRAAAALLTFTGRRTVSRFAPCHPARRRSASAFNRVAHDVPDLAGRCAFFTANTSHQLIANSGATVDIDQVEADQMVRQAVYFLEMAKVASSKAENPFAELQFPIWPMPWSIGVDQCRLRPSDSLIPRAFHDPLRGR